MAGSAARNLHSPIDSICAEVQDVAGIQLGANQKAMVEARLTRRFLQLGLKNLDDYYTYFRSNQEKEMEFVVGLLTTHHTFFFREFSQFEYLQKKVLPELIPIVRARPNKTLRLWSAACSRGQEVYSLAMFLDFHLKIMAPDVKFHILGTDIDNQSIAAAKNGVYQYDEIKEVPMTFLGQHWARGTGDIANFVKAKPSLKNNCQFDTKNLFQIPPQFAEPFDVIFCRNVFIYFNTDQIKSIGMTFSKLLQPHGFLFVGISESIGQLGLPIDQVEPSIFRLKGFKKESVTKPPPKVETQVVAPSGPIKVFCIDDSPSVHTLLKKILSEGGEFEIIGTAGDGIEASEKLRTLKPDVITLDIHMPRQTGIEYLEKNYSSSHPPVVMVTSVAREDAGIAMKALSLGASDYVEKPALSNLSERGEEIRAKLKTVAEARRLGAQINKSLAQEFKRNIQVTSPENKFRIVMTAANNRDKIIDLVKELSGDQPATVFLTEGGDGALGELAKFFKEKTGRKFEYIESGDVPLSENTFYIGDSKKCMDGLKSRFGKRKTSILVHGQISRHSAIKVLEWDGAQLLIEDNFQKGSPLAEVASDIVPATSFGYMSCHFMEGGK